jgi:hypothetical protein
MGWLEVCATNIFKKYATIDKNAPYNRNALQKAFQNSANGLEELFSRSWENGGKIKSFKKLR